MNCGDNENVCSVKKENNLGYYRIHTIWKNDSFLLNVTSKDGAWCGEMEADEVKKLSDQLDMEPDLYLKHCRLALTSHDGQPGMVYSVENGSFTWKKIVDEDSGIKIRMGSVMLQPANFINTIQNLVNAALNCNKHLQKELYKLNEEKEKIGESRNEILNKLVQLNEIKNKMEDDLYKRFILLLNSKKKKIKELETCLNNKCERVTISESKGTEDDPFEVDTDYEVELMEEMENVKEELLISQSSGEKMSRNEGNTVMEDKPETSSSSCPKRKSEIPLTKDGVLEYFYGGS